MVDNTNISLPLSLRPSVENRLSSAEFCSSLPTISGRLKSSSHSPGVTSGDPNLCPIAGISLEVFAFRQPLRPNSRIKCLSQAPTRQVNQSPPHPADARLHSRPPRHPSAGPQALVTAALNDHEHLRNRHRADAQMLAQGVISSRRLLGTLAERQATSYRGRRAWRDCRVLKGRE